MFSLLGIGNSFSDDSFAYIERILSSVGIDDVKIENLFIPGCSIDRHVKNIENGLPAYELRRWQNGYFNFTDYKLKDALTSENWQYISLQQYSGTSGLVESYARLESLISYVRQNTKDVKLLWNMTWAYKGTSDNPGFVNYNKDQKTMYDSIVDTFKKVIVPNREFFKIIPIGTAIQNARTSKVGDNLTRDTTHLSFDFGRYIAGLTYVCSLLDIRAEEVRFVPDGVDDERREIAIESVNRAIRFPFEVSVSKL